ncbi:hypothetical protein N7474_002537 [Penicillium riverlandense]|uniref:uncharacterized protein n=1 Tax=Penicillium riverlandense TaxID=1903569 RepID=UPI00254754E3|nr:uncharacterized protein N7474_002537 [Penicillium riverlandense]KAJ5825399.1 hypothetical protein N7474_002537 [Penicillium riverlandense]
MESGRKKPQSEPLSESEKHDFSTYEKRPPNGYLLGKHFKERTYFDSGDFALSAAQQETDNGAIQTGREHPRRESISHPYAPVPSTSNVDQHANEDLDRKTASPERSHLHQHTDVEPEGSTTYKEEQSKTISQSEDAI